MKAELLKTSLSNALRKHGGPFTSGRCGRITGCGGPNGAHGWCLACALYKQAAFRRDLPRGDNKKWLSLELLPSIADSYDLSLAELASMLRGWDGLDRVEFVHEGKILKCNENFYQLGRRLARDFVAKEDNL